MSTIDTIPALRRAIARFQREGYSMRTALKVYRGGGGTIRTDDFAVLWRDEARKAEQAGD